MLAGVIVALIVGFVTFIQPEIRTILKNFFRANGATTAIVTPSPVESPPPTPSGMNETPEPAAHPQPTATPAEETAQDRYQLELYDGFEGDEDVQQDVRELQELLNKNGYSLAVDGLFGLATEEAVRQFQSEHGLENDGIVGSETWTALLAN